MYGKFIFLGMIGFILFGIIGVGFSDDFKCPPTPADIKGPFYKPGAAIRDSVGVGYVLSGIVKSAKDCSPIAKDKIEFWLTGPDGNYDDDHRATVTADYSVSIGLRAIFRQNLVSGRPIYTSRSLQKDLRSLFVNTTRTKGLKKGCSTWCWSLYE